MHWIEGAIHVLESVRNLRPNGSPLELESRARSTTGRNLLRLTCPAVLALIASPCGALETCTLEPLGTWTISEPVGDSPEFYDTTAYLAAEGADVRIVDFSNPTNPHEVGFVTVPGQVHDLAVHRGLLFVLSWDHPEAGLRIYDLSDPSLPSLVGVLVNPLWGMLQIAVSGQVVALLTYDVLLDEVVVHFLDVSNPASISPAGTWDGFSGVVGGIAFSGDLLLATAEFDGVYVIDVSSPATPTTIGGVPGFSVTRPFLSGSRALVEGFLDGNPEGIAILDLSTPSTPAILGVVDWECATDPVGIGPFLFFPYCIPTPPGDPPMRGVALFDISDPSAPTNLDLESTPGDANGVAFTGGKVLATYRIDESPNTGEVRSIGV